MRGGTAFLLACLLGAGLPAPVEADILQDLGATFQQVAEELARALPKVETRVVAVDGDTIRLIGAEVARLRPGLELTAYRKGERFRHPITNQPLGQSEVQVATLAVTEVTADFAVARVVTTEGGQTPAVGDGARITAGRLLVAVLPTEGVQAPFETADQTTLLLVTRLSALLEKTGRFRAVDPQRVLDLAGHPPGPALGPLEAARRLGAPAVLSSRVVLEGRSRMLEATWWSAKSGAPLVSLRQPVVRASFPPRFAWEQTPELERRMPLEGPVRGLALADVDGDGRLELITADEDAITVHRWQDVGSPGPVVGATLRTGGIVLSVDAADVNQAGRAQIAVTDYRGSGGSGGRDGVRGRVLEWQGGELRTLYETTGRFLRMIRVGTEAWLLEQDGGDPDPFTGTIRRLVWQDGRYRDGPTLRVPPGVSVYGLALLGLTGSPEPDIVAVTPEDRLVAWTAKGQRLWTSVDPYGGSTVTFPYAGEGRGQAASDVVMGRVPARVAVLPEGGAGPEVLVYENLLPALEQGRTILPRLAPVLFTQARVHRLRWKEGGFIRVWQSAATDGYIADLAFGDLDGDSIPEVVVAVMPRGLNLDTLNPFGRLRAQLVFYELP